jgi:hypothetical protein
MDLIKLDLVIFVSPSNAGRMLAGFGRLEGFSRFHDVDAVCNGYGYAELMLNVCNRIQ